MPAAPANTAMFDSFQADHPEQRRALAHALQFCADMENRRFRWLSLLGPSGRGKTHLARCVEAWRKSRGGAGYFYRWLDLLQRFREDREQIARFMRRCDDSRLLIVDDIGAGYETEFAAATLAEIAERRQGRATMFTSNFTMEQIAELDSRIASRMIRGQSAVFTFRDLGDFNL